MYVLRGFPFLAVMCLTACFDGRPAVPNDEVAAKPIYSTGRMLHIGIESIKTECRYADPPRSAITDQWMTVCDYKAVFTDPARARSTMREAGELIFMWHENATHDGQGAWRAYTP